MEVKETFMEKEIRLYEILKKDSNIRKEIKRIKDEPFSRLKEYERTIFDYNNDIYSYKLNNHPFRNTNRLL
jgi:hypothetical protein